jgi:hypothetical protein
MYVTTFWKKRFLETHQSVEIVVKLIQVAPVFTKCSKAIPVTGRGGL